MPKLRRMILLALGTLAACYLLAAAALYALQSKLLYFPPRPAEVAPSDGVEVWRVTYEGGDVPALYVAPAPGAATLVWFHGNAEQIADLVHLARQVRQRAGLGFFAAEFPGYGTSQGPPASEPALLAAAEAALRSLGGHGKPMDRLVLVGRSLGSGVAAQLAARQYGARLVLVSPYTSIADRAAELYPWLPVRWLVRDRFESLAACARIRVPTLVVHGARDEVIPLPMGRAIAAAIPGARLLVLPTADHDDVLRAEGGLEAVLAFAQER